MQDFKEMFNLFLASKGLKSTKQRHIILDHFIALDRQLDVKELFASLHAKSHRASHGTIYSTLKLFVESGIAHEIKFDGGVTGYGRVSEMGLHPRN